MQQVFLNIYLQEYDKLKYWVRRRLQERGYRGNLTDAVNTILHRAVEVAYENSKKEHLTRTYTIKKLIWLKMKNELYNFLHPPKKDAACEELDDSLTPTDPEPDIKQQIETQDELDQVLLLLTPEQRLIFSRLSEDVSYEDLALEFNTTDDALKQKVYRWRKKFRQQWKGKNWKFYF